VSDPELLAKLDQILTHSQAAAEVRPMAEANTRAIGKIEKALGKQGEAIHRIDKAQGISSAGSVWVGRFVWLIVGGLVTSAFAVVAYALSHAASG